MSLLKHTVCLLALIAILSPTLGARLDQRLLGRQNEQDDTVIDESDAVANKAESLYDNIIATKKLSWTTCDWRGAPKFSCNDCNTRVICKSIGGILKTCSDATPYCRNGFCSAIPSDECATAIEEEEEDGDKGAAVNNTVEEDASSAEPENEVSEPLPIDDEVSEPVPVEEEASEAEIEAGEEETSQIEELGEGQMENKVKKAYLNRNQLRRQNEQYDNLVSDVAADEAETLGGFIIPTSRQSWAASITCDCRAAPKFSCNDCNTRVICKPIVGGILKSCDGTTPYCRNGFCSAIPSDECATATEEKEEIRNVEASSVQLENEVSEPMPVESLSGN